MKAAYLNAWRWSIFASDSLPVTITVQSQLSSLSATDVSRALERAGATVEEDHGGRESFSCRLPAHRFVGFGYARRFELRCRVEVKSNSTGETHVALTYDAALLRRSKLRLFYFWSICFALLAIPNVIRNGWDPGTALFLFAPWPAVEAHFVYDRWRLRENVVKSLRPVSE